MSVTRWDALICRDQCIPRQRRFVTLPTARRAGVRPEQADEPALPDYQPVGRPPSVVCWTRQRSRPHVCVLSVDRRSCQLALRRDGTNGGNVKTEDFHSHTLWNTLDALQAKVEGDLHLTEDEDRYNARRLHAVVEYLDSLRDVDPVLLEPQALNDMGSHLQQVLNALDSYLADPDGNRQYLASAAGYILNVTTNARTQLVPFVPDEAQRAAKAASTRFKNALDAEVQRLKAEVDALSEQLAGEKQQREADDEAAQERLSALTATIAEREATVDTLTTKLNAQIDLQRTSFEQEAAARAETFKEAEAGREEVEGTRIEAAEAALAKAREEQAAEAAALIAKLETYKAQAAALVDTTSRHAIAGDYGTWASNQAEAALRWTVATVVIGLGTVAGLIYAVGSAADDSIQFTIYKTSISVVGLIVAAYCARQAAEHRKEERTAKRLALDLAALEPFLEQIDDPKELREEIARRVFVPERLAPDGEGSIRVKGGSMSVGQIAELLTALNLGNKQP